MIMQLFRRRILPERQVFAVFQAAISLVAAMVLVVGFWRAADLELNEAQMYLAFGIILGLALQCITLGVIMEFARRHSNRE